MISYTNVDTIHNQHQLEYVARNHGKYSRQRFSAKIFIIIPSQEGGKAHSVCRMVGFAIQGGRHTLCADCRRLRRLRPPVKLKSFTPEQRATKNRTNTQSKTRKTRTKKMNAKISRQRTAIPVKQKNVIKLVMWTLYQVLDEDAAKSKTLEMLKLNESVENIIEQVDNIEKTEKYGEMETMMTMIRTNQVVKKQTNVLNELSGDADTIIKQMVEMATAEVTTTKVTTTKVKAVKKPRGAKKTAVEASEATEASADGEATETKVKKPRAKKTVAVVEATEATADGEATETKVKKPRAKKTATIVEATEASVSVVEASAPVDTKVKKPRAKKTAVEASATEASATEAPADGEASAPAPKKPRAKKTQAVVEPPVKEEVKSTEDLQEEEYLVLNEIEYEGTTYMVGTDQNVYDEFNAIIGKYENEKVILN